MNYLSGQFSSLNEKIIGSTDSSPLEHRIFTMITFYGILQCLMASVTNYLANMGLFVTILPLGAAFIFFSIYYFTRFRSYYSNLIWLFIFTCLTTLIIIWIYNGGYDSPNGYVYFITLMITLMIIGKSRRFLVLSLFLIVFILMNTLHYLYPEFITPYKTRGDRFVDLLFTSGYNMLLLYGIVTYVMNNYLLEKTNAESEKKKTLAINQELIAKNFKISEQNSMLEHLNIELLNKNVQILQQFETLEELHGQVTEQNTQISQQNIELEALNDELMNINQRLDRVNYELVETNSAKDKFFSILSHDLKNPLSAVKNYTDMLKFTERLTPSQINDISASIGKSVDFVLDLLDNLLNWSQSQTGRIEFNPEIIPFKTFLDNYKPKFEIIARKKGITVSFDNNENHEVFADINMVKTVIRNIFTNAVKFTDYGGNISIKASVENDKFVKTTVSDTGIGIEQEDLQKLFRIDSHHSTIGTSSEKGTGLGLILCKEFIEKNGGNIWAESEFGQGSAFSFTLPKA